ncbi:MAG: hypothetical protein ABS951_00235 [Solibacillus sp.]
MNWRKLAIVLTCLGAVIWFVHRQTGLEALPRVDKIETLLAANAHTTYENGEYLENLKIVQFEGEMLTELGVILKDTRIRRETFLNRVNEKATGDYHLTIMTGEKEVRLHIEDTNRIIVHADRTYIVQNDALINFLKERFRSDDVYSPGTES